MNLPRLQLATRVYLMGEDILYSFGSGMRLLLQLLCPGCNAQKILNPNQSRHPPTTAIRKIVAKV